LSQWDKLIDRVKEADRSLRFDELAKVLNKIGYTHNKPKGGGSHHVFRAPGLPPISIPKDNPINKAYIELVRETVIRYLNEVNSDE